MGSVFCQKTERTDHILHSVFVNKKQFVGYRNGAGYVKKILEARASKHIFTASGNAVEQFF